MDQRELHRGGVMSWQWVVAVGMAVAFVAGCLAMLACAGLRRPSPDVVAAERCYAKSFGGNVNEDAS